MDFNWLGIEEFNFAIKRRRELIDFWRDEIKKANIQIDKLEEEVYGIEQSRANLEALMSNTNIVQGESLFNKSSYDLHWTWFEKAYFVLQYTKEYSSIKQIVDFLGGIDKEVRDMDKTKRRHVQAAITNAFKSRVENKSIVVIEDKEENCKKYGLPEWPGIIFSNLSIVNV